MSPISHTIPLKPVAPRPQTSIETRLRRLLALAAVAICGLSIAVGALATDGDSAKASAGKPAVVPVALGSAKHHATELQHHQIPLPIHHLRGSKASDTGR
jgi:hypothetical protein